MNLSNSNEQQDAERYILDELNKKLDLNLKSQKIQLPNGSNVQLDGFDEGKNAICEIYARIGKLKGSQPDKVASDFLKMLFVEKSRKVPMKKYFCFASDEAKRLVEGNSWLAGVVEYYEIKIEIIKLPKDIVNLIKKVQNRQKMVNKNEK